MFEIMRYVGMPVKKHADRVFTNTIYSPKGEEITFYRVGGIL